MDTAEVHWCEGLFLQPHHFQYHQRALDARLSLERRLATPYDYGLIDADIFDEGLANKVVRFDRLEAVLPGGPHLLLGENADLDQLDIAAEFDRSNNPLIIWLTLPIWSRDASNVEDPDKTHLSREPKLFSVEPREWRDENTGDNPQEVLIRRYQARLVAGARPPNNFTALPVLRLIRGAGQKLGQPVIDPTFIPPCLLARGWQPLLALAEEIAVDADNNRDVVARGLKSSGFSPQKAQGAQLMQVQRLMLLGRYSTRLLTLIKTPGCRPIELFLELRSLLAELHGLRPDIDYSATPDYDHDAPGPAFNDLYLRIRQLMAGSVAPTFREAAFELRERVLVTKLEKAESDGCEFFLAVDTKFDPKQVADFVEDRTRFKVMSPSTALAAFPGIKLGEERAPIGLPMRDHRYFFRFLTGADQFSVDMWKRIAAEGTIVLNWRELEQHQAKQSLNCLLFVVGAKPRQDG